MIKSIVFLLFFGSGQVAAAEDKVSEEMFSFVPKANENLQVGTIDSNDNARGVSATKVSDVSFEAVLAAVTDYDNFSEYMPKVKKSKTTKKLGEHSWVDTKLNFGLFSVDYVLKMREWINRDRNRAVITWKRDSGDMKEINGKWILVKSSSGKTVIKYLSKVDAGMIIPGWIQDMLTKGAVPDLFEAVEQRAKQIAGAGNYQK